jgi:predicted metal-binding membrane protein
MDMPMPGGTMMMAPRIGWSIGYAGLMFAMWWVMMVAMMLPSAAPMILLFDSANARAAGQGATPIPTAIFASAYLLAWAFFSVLAVALQWGLTGLGLLDNMMRSTSLTLNAALLIAAGLYQFTPVKQACLRHCRSPLQFVMEHWRPGRIGALEMGIRHGAFCLGCCWFLMALLFFGGVMNLAWIGGLALYVLIEKLAPHGDLIGRLGGTGLIAWGVWLLAMPQ